MTDALRSLGLPGERPTVAVTGGPGTRLDAREVVFELGVLGAAGLRFEALLTGELARVDEATAFAREAGLAIPVAVAEGTLARWAPEMDLVLVAEGPGAEEAAAQAGATPAAIVALPVHGRVRPERYAARRVLPLLDAVEAALAGRVAEA